MSQSVFEAEARTVAVRNLTPNVAGVAASMDSLLGHLEVTYFLFGAPTDDDGELRELTVGELIAAFPEIQTAVSDFGTVEEMSAAKDRLVFAKG